MRLEPRRLVVGGAFFGGPTMTWRLPRFAAARTSRRLGQKPKHRLRRSLLEELETRALLATGATAASYGLTGPVGQQQGVTAPAGAIVLSASSGTANNQAAINNAAAGATIFFQ